MEKALRVSSKKNYIGDFLGKKSLYIMGISCFIFVVIFSYLPLCGWIIAFFNYKPGVRISKVPFVGFKWFYLILSQPELLYVLRNTLIMSMLGLLCSPIPAFLAILVSEMRSKVFGRVIQIVTTFPNFISWVLVFSVCYAILSPVDGLINKILINLNVIDNGLNPIGNGDIVWFFQTGIGIWKGAGFGAIIYFASLTGIDPELYDAAEVDGAGRFRKIIHIKIPGLYATYFTLLILGIGNILNNGFEQYYLFYNGMVAEKIEVLDYYVYQVGIIFNNYSMSTAIGITKTFISVILLTLANLLSKRIRGVSII